MKLVRFIGASALLLVILAACQQKPKDKYTDTYTSGTIAITADESFEPIIQEEIDVFQNQFPLATVKPRYVTEVEAIKQLLDDSVRLAIASRRLTAEEKRRVWDFLVGNMRPENREYRYDYLYDNCTTRARDCVEKSVDGEIVYPESDSVRTFRGIIHQYTVDYPWAELGNDICLGVQADRPISEREEMFAPFYLLDYVGGAVIRDAAGRERPLVLSTSEIVKGGAVRVRPEFPLSPAWAAWLLFAFVAALTVAERLRHASFWLLDILLMALVGAIGLVVTFLFFFSAHPTVGSNWQIWVFNPVPLLAMPWVVRCAIRGEKTRYHRWNIFVLIFFMIFSAFIPQDFCVVVVPLALTLLLRSCSYELSYLKQGKK